MMSHIDLLSFFHHVARAVCSMQRDCKTEARSIRMRFLLSLATSHLQYRDYKKFLSKDGTGFRRVGRVVLC